MFLLVTPRLTSCDPRQTDRQDRRSSVLHTRVISCFTVFTVLKSVIVCVCMCARVRVCSALLQHMFMRKHAHALLVDDFQSILCSAATWSVNPWSVCVCVSE